MLPTLVQVDAGYRRSTLHIRQQVLKKKVKHGRHPILSLRKSREAPVALLPADYDDQV